MAEKPKSGILFLLWLLCITFSLAGVQFVYSIQFAVGTPLFSQELKLSTSIVSIILSTAGPISGFIVQPIVGVYSDGCTSRLGRRRPFILAGTLICAVGMAIIGNAVTLGNMLGDNPDGQTPSEHKAGIAFAVTGLWLMNLMVNMIQGPARAIVADVVPADQQNAGNSMVAGVMGLAAIIANVVGAQFLGKPQPYRYLFLIGLGFVLFSCIPTLIFAKETPFVKKPKDTSVNDPHDHSDKNVFVKIFYGFKHMPRPLIKVAVVYFFSWCAFSPFMIYLSAFFGQNVYGGNNTDKQQQYQEGVKMAMYSLAIFAGVQWIYSLILPPLIKATSPKICYFFSQLIATASFVLFLFFHSPIEVPFVLTAVIAPNFCTFNTIPFAIVAESSNLKDAGLYMGVLNSASVVAQTVTELLSGLILKYRDQNVAWGIAFGGVLSLLACLCVFLIENPKKTEKGESEPLLSPK